MINISIYLQTFRIPAIFDQIRRLPAPSLVRDLIELPYDYKILFDQRAQQRDLSHVSH